MIKKNDKKINYLKCMKIIVKKINDMDKFVNLIILNEKYNEQLLIKINKKIYNLCNNQY